MLRSDGSGTRGELKQPPKKPGDWGHQGVRMGKVWSVYASSGKLLVVGSRGRVVGESGLRAPSQTWETNAVDLLPSEEQTDLGSD